MKPGKHIERAAKSLLLAPKILLRYGTLSPTQVRIVGCDHWIHIDPDDRRAIKKFVHDPLRHRISPPLSFWRDFLAKLVPAVAVDVGVNYGECLFGARYNPSTRVFGFEANPLLMPYLEKSREAHPDGANITLVQGLVSDRAATAVNFYADPSWSGTGSAVPALNEGSNIVTSEVAAHTLDSRIPLDAVAGKPLLFKMDIEGFESRAIMGFDETLDAAELAVGLIEFDTTFIRAASEDPQRYFASLEERFDIHCLVGGKAGALRKVAGFDRLPISRASDKRVHTDLLLSTRGDDPKSWLPAHWSIIE